MNSKNAKNPIGQVFHNFLSDTRIYNPEEIKDVLKKVRPYFSFAYTGKKHKYFNVPCSFDIETTSFYETEEPDMIRDTEVYDYIKGHILKYSDSIKSDFPDFEEIRKKYFGVITFSKTKGTSIDTLYKELSELYPYYFPDDVYNVSDELSIILDVLDTNKPIKSNSEKVAIMYGWTFGIFGAVILGRTWEQFVTMLDVLVSELDLNKDKRLLIYCHNLSHEFQYISSHFTWLKVFATAPREPIYALTVNGVEFRCSYILSGYSLQKLGEELSTYKVHKLVGELDYEKPRHNKTVLEPGEKEYMSNDVKVVMAFIMESIERDGSIARIPLTKTGYARRYVRNNCWYSPEYDPDDHYKRFKYSKFIKGLKLEPEEYKQLKRAFQGGFTHANPFCVGKTIEDVTSFDFTSSYPAVMVSEEYPMSTGELITIESKEQFEDCLNCYWCLFDVEFIDIHAKLLFDNYISRSRCSIAENAIIDNGRIVSSTRLVTSITGEDYTIIKNFYSWDSMRVFNFRRYKKAYLPTDFVKAILKLYSDKTTLKGVKGKEVELQVAKGLLNSCYGMTCTDIVRPENIFTSGEWTTKEPNLKDMIEKYNKSGSRFLHYPWGVAVCAYARRNLFSGILEFQSDYCYSDTDSIKVIHAKEHAQYIEDYNKWIIGRLKRACDYHGIDYAMIEPENIKGVKKPLGVWDFDGHYKRFKTLGAKRYMVEYDSGEINLTVSGLNKKAAVPYICQKWNYDIKTRKENNSPFDVFTNNMYVPPDYTGKMTHTYIDDLKRGYLTDYNGVTAAYEELSAVHLSKQDYNLSISREFTDYLSSIVYL